MELDFKASQAAKMRRSSKMTNSSSSSNSNSNTHTHTHTGRGGRSRGGGEEDVELGLSIGGGHGESLDTSLFVKVYMEGQPIGRKLNMMAHSGYDHLIATLDHMFNANIIHDDHHHYSPHHHQQHVLTYQDDEGDWLMIGDVPWELFLSSVKRLNISRAYPS